jgi:signal transduction histidine kinase
MHAQPETTEADFRAKLRRIRLSTRVGTALWVVLTALLTVAISNRVLSSSLTNAAATAAHDGEAISGEVDRMFHELATVPRILATDRDLLAIAARYRASSALGHTLARLRGEARGRQLKDDADVSRVNERLTSIRNNLGYDLVFVLNDRGIRIVSSDWDQPTALLGAEFDDRDFYSEPMAGRPGQTFAVARVTRNPALFFTAPMSDDSGVIGVMGVRQSSEAIGAALAGGRQVAILVDRQGMIIASSRPELLLQHVSALTDRRPDTATLREVYAQDALRALDITRPARARHADEWIFDGAPYLLERQPLETPSYSLLVLWPLDRLLAVGTLHYVIGVLVMLFGLLLGLLVDRRAEGAARRRHNERTTAELNATLTALNKDKDRYLGIAAHDLRNPLSTMRGLAEMMLEAPLEPDQQREFLETIHRTSDEMLGLVNDLLDVAVIESGKLDLRRSELDVGTLVRQRVRQLEPYARSKTIEIQVDAVEGLRANIDRARFSQVVDNLVSNAIKFSPSDTRVDVTLRSTDGLTLGVQDQGPGIPEQDRNLMFHSFQKLSARPTAGENSTGLGLAIVKKIVDAHGGRIEVGDAPGGGARFTVMVPTAIAGAKVDGRQAEYSGVAG